MIGSVVGANTGHVLQGTMCLSLAWMELLVRSRSSSLGDEEEVGRIAEL